jgi:hypothetical protein
MGSRERQPPRMDPGTFNSERHGCQHYVRRKKARRPTGWQTVCNTIPSSTTNEIMVHWAARRHSQMIARRMTALLLRSRRSRCVAASARRDDREGSSRSVLPGGARLQQALIAMSDAILRDRLSTLRALLRLEPREDRFQEGIL